jgi:cation:H+ antiporter
VIPLTLLLFGLGGLWAGTLLAVRGAVGLSEKFGLSHGFVGLAVLAIGTDLPELVVAVGGGIKELQGIDASGMVVGAAVGSAIVQGSLVLGIAGLVGYLPSGPRMVRRDGATLVLALVLASALWLDGTVSRVDGVVMVLVYALYFRVLYRMERVEGEGVSELPPPARLSATQATIVGLAMVAVSAQFVLEGGLALAEVLGMDQTLLAVIFVGAGTSLPELALSIRAVVDRHGSLSVGNVIGSNIFDLLMPAGVGAIIHPLSVDRGTFVFDLPAAAVVTAALLVFLVHRKGIQRREALVLVLLYLAYVALRVGAA